jgi:hypothetical protein
MRTKLPVRFFWRAVIGAFCFVALWAGLVRAWPLGSIARLPIFKEDTAPELAATKRDQLDDVHRLVTAEAKGDEKLRAATETLGYRESRYSLRITRSECKPHECDPRRLKGGALEFRARGAWQLHRNGMSDAAWAALAGPDSLPAQAKEATRRVRAALGECRGDVRGAFALLGGRGCSGTLPDMAERLETYRKLGGL